MDIINVLLDPHDNEIITSSAITELINNHSIPLSHKDLYLIFKKFRENIDKKVKPWRNLAMKEYKFILSETLKEHPKLFLAIMFAIKSNYAVEHITYLIDRHHFEREYSVTEYKQLGYSYAYLTNEINCDECVYCDLYKYYEFDIDALNITDDHRKIIQEFIDNKERINIKPAVKK